tara:strand:- start:588 stop:1040 length:453 start_codon:yes stop_codon:yes gene_type:complete
MSKTEWGNATWYIIHTLSYKLKRSENHHVGSLFKELVHISTNLPCPDCSQHARMYINHAKSVPRNRNELITFFWGMHNWVNNKLHKPQFSSKDFVAKYDLARTSNVIQYYISIISKNGRYDKAMLSTFNRSIMVTAFIKYINNNIHRFNA